MSTPTAGEHGPIWFTRTLVDHRPAVPSLPASLVVVEVGPLRGVHHRDVLWLPIGDRVVAVPCPGPVWVVVEGAVLVVEGADGRTVSVRDGVVSVDPSPHRRAGRDLVLVREAARWTSAPTEGAATSARTRPWARGRGWIWADAGWVYRRSEAGPTEVVGPIAPSEHLVAGPDGAVLVGDAEAWTHAAAPRRPLVPLDAPLLRDGTARFAPDGALLVGREPDGDGFVRVDAATGRALEQVDGGVPTASAWVEPGDGTDAGEALLAADPALEGDLLAGPGGRVWRLDGGPIPLALLPSSGPFAPAGERWAAWDDGVVRWFDPTTGRTRGRSRVPLGEPVAAWGADGAAAFVDASGALVVLDASGHVCPVPPRPPPPPRPPEAWAHLGLDHAVQAGGRTVAWSADGLLLVTPR